MRESLVNHLVHYLFTHKDEWISKGHITEMKWKDRRGKTFLPETVGRKLREAEESSRIAVKNDDRNKSIVYKWLPPERRERYIRTIDRQRGAENKLFRV